MPPTPITVAQLANIPLPTSSHRTAPWELTNYITHALITPGEPHIEHDADTHISFKRHTVVV